MAFYWILSILLDGRPSSISPKSALLHFGEGSYAGQFYFIILLQVLFFAAFLLPEGLWRTRRAVLLPAAAAAAGLALLAVAPSIIEAHSPPRWTARLLTDSNWVWLWFCYFALGSRVGSRSRSKAKGAPRSRRVLGAATVLAAIAIATAGIPAFPEWDAPDLYPYSRLAIFLGTSLIALELSSLASIRLARPARALGVHSFGIYVFNPCILLILFRLLGKPADPWVSWLYAAITLVCALLLTRWLTRWAPFMVP